MRISGLNDLHRVIYFSRVAVSVANAQAECVGQILAISVANNARVNVTGALLVCDGWFIQALEGRRIDVDMVLQRILHDERHIELHRLASGPVDERRFATWNMCAAALAPTDAEIVDVLEGSGGFDPRKLTPEKAMELLSMVGRLQDLRAPHRASEMRRRAAA